MASSVNDPVRKLSCVFLWFSEWSKSKLNSLADKLRVSIFTRCLLFNCVNILQLDWTIFKLFRQLEVCAVDLTTILTTVLWMCDVSSTTHSSSCVLTTPTSVCSSSSTITCSSSSRRNTRRKVSCGSSLTSAWTWPSVSISLKRFDHSENNEFIQWPL